MSLRHSENEDDPEPFQSSGEDWEEKGSKKETKGNRKSSRVSRPSKKKLYEDSEEEEEPMSSEELSEEEEPIRKRKNKRGPKPKKPNAKKSKVSTDDADESDEESDAEESNDDEDEDEDDDDKKDGDSDKGGNKSARKFLPKTIFSDDFANGSFVIQKKDAQGGDPSKHPVIWRIDGKALLQKYEAFDEETKVYHKNTSIYTGWSPLDKDLYAPITVDVIRHNNSNLTVEVHWEQLKFINNDDDD